MREISFVKRLKFNFQGSVTKRALYIGDADNDQRNELVCANLQGDLAIFKDKRPEKFAYASNLGMVTACLVGDITNSGQNYVAAINTEGWLFIFDALTPISNQGSFSSLVLNTNPSSDSSDVSHPKKLTVMYDQRMPANCKEILLADLDGDGQNEVIIGLTDRVLRTYKWIKIGGDRGKFVGLYKWEFADQIGSVSLNPSRHANCQDIIVAQPGGTYAKLECFDKKPMNSTPTLGSISEQKINQESSQQNQNGSPNDGDNVRTEYISKLTPEYHQLALAQMRNHHISTEVLGGIRNGKVSENNTLIVIATLDGTLMMINKDDILWSLQVDHQLFALATLESRKRNPQSLPQSESTCTIVSSVQYDNQSRPKSSERSIQHFVACAWNGKTYIIDEERNYLRFKFEEAVSAFTAGNYCFDDADHSVLVYATFNDQIVVYYDVVDDQISPTYLLNEILNNPENNDIATKLDILADKLGIPKTKCNDLKQCDSADASRIYNVLQDVLYSMTDQEIRSLSSEIR